MSVLKYIDPTTGKVKKLFAPVIDSYTKTETNNLLSNKADLDENGKVPNSQLPDISVDAYTKEETLSDTVKTVYGLDSNAIPNDVFSKLAGASVPTGTICWYAKDDIPSGYLKCDGSAISRSNYSALFRVIGTVFGTGDESTTFNIPDLRAKFIRGSGTSGVYSATFGQTQAGTNFQHQFGSVAGAPGYSFYYNYESINNTDNATWGSGQVGAGQSSGSVGMYTSGYIRPYNIALTPIIKY